MLESSQSVALAEEPAPSTGYYWSTKETAILKKHYPVGGMKLVQPLLPDRPERAIYAKADALGLKYAVRSRSGKNTYTNSPFIDSAIQEAYRGGLQRGDREKLAKSIGRPAWWIGRRAEQLCLTRMRTDRAPWSEAEIALLEQRGHMTAGSLRNVFSRAGFKRSRSAIQVMRFRLGIDKEATGHLTAGMIAARMGVDSTTVRRWITLYGLKSTSTGAKRPSNGAVSEGDVRVVSEGDFRRWCAANPSRVEVRRVKDSEWFIRVLSGQKA